MDERGFSKQDAGTGYRHHKDSHRVSMASDIETIVEPLSRVTFSYIMSSSKNIWMLGRTLGKGLHGMPLGLPSFRGVVALHPDEIAVTDHTSGRVIVYNTEGTVKRTIETTRNISDIAATHDNRLVVSERATDVKVFNEDNTLAFQFPTVPPSEVGKTAVDLRSVAVKKDGTIIVGDVKRMVLTEHSPTDGSLIRTIPVKTKPYFLAVDSDDRIFIGDLYAVHVFAINDEQLFSIQPTIDGEPVKYCRGVCFNNSDIFVVTGTIDEGHIHRYDTQGNFLGCAVQGLRDPWGVTFTPDGPYLAVADSDSVKMYISDVAQRATNIIGPMATCIIGPMASVASSGGSFKWIEDTTEERSFPVQVHSEPGFRTKEAILKYNEQRAEDVSCLSLEGGENPSPWRPGNHLEAVLDEYKKQGGEAEHKTLQLPYIAVGYFDEKGGSLSLDEYDVHLTIPRGAIHPSPPRQVYIYIDPTAPPVHGVKPPDVALSRMIQCGPQGLKFAESVVLSFPHHAVTSSQTADELGARMRQDETTSDTWEEFDGNVALVTEDRAILLVDHFTLFAIFGRSSKRLMVGAFGDLFQPLCRRYRFRVHVWNDDKANAKYVQDEEKSSEKLDALRNVEFCFGKGDLAVEVFDLQEGWKVREGNRQLINEQRIKKFQSNSVTFNLHQPSHDVAAQEDLHCRVQSFQDLAEQNGICLSVSLPVNTPKCSTVQKSQSTQELSGACSEMFGSIPGAEGEGPCECKTVLASVSCGGCKERLKVHMGARFSQEVHGSIDSANYGGLSEQAVWDLCEHLDEERDGCNNWIQLAERLTSKGYTFIRKARSMKHPTKELLKVFFEVYRAARKDGNTAIETLLSELEALGLDRAVQVIQHDLNHNIF